MTEARREFDAWVEREYDYVTGRPELCDWTTWQEAWQISEKLTIERCAKWLDSYDDPVNARRAEAIRTLGDE